MGTAEGLAALVVEAMGGEGDGAVDLGEPAANWHRRGQGEREG